MNLKKVNKNTRGFTLIEILVVIGIIAVLAAIVIVAINPARQFAQARNTQRTSNVETILNAIGQRMADNKGIFEGTVTSSTGTYKCGKLPTAEESITNIEAANITDPTGNLGCLVPTYISALPNDPAWTTTADSDTLYDLIVTNGRVKVCAPNSAETALGMIAADEICVTR